MAQAVQPLAANPVQPAPDAVERRAVEGVRRHARSAALPPFAAWLGLGETECRALLQRVGIDPMLDAAPIDAADTHPHLQPLIALMWEHRVSDNAWTRLMAGTLASACFGQNHLWQDLGLAGRPEVSGLMDRHFPSLAAGNTRSLKWKRYLFLRLGETMGLPDLAPPGCDGCDEAPVCFAPPAEFAGIAIRKANP